MAFPDKETSDINFADEAVVQSDVPVVSNGDLQIKINLM